MTDTTQPQKADKPIREFFIFDGNLAEAREAFGENLAIRDTGKTEKQLEGYFTDPEIFRGFSKFEKNFCLRNYLPKLNEELIKIDACGIIHAKLIHPNDNTRYFRGVPVYRKPITI